MMCMYLDVDVDVDVDVLRKVSIADKAGSEIGEEVGRERKGMVGEGRGGEAGQRGEVTGGDVRRYRVIGRKGGGGGRNRTEE